MAISKNTAAKRMSLEQIIVLLVANSTIYPITLQLMQVNVSFVTQISFFRKKNETESDYCYYNGTQSSMKGCAVLDSRDFNRERLFCKKCYDGWIFNTGTKSCIQYDGSISYDGSGTPSSATQGQGGTGADGGASLANSYTEDTAEYTLPEAITTTYEGFLKCNYKIIILLLRYFLWFLVR
eukprot:TRINITY_DN3779_c0_g1_i16.p2 TRINITY_DN3779_c0_g1~~TRINITY_DN3779_c0_g1_i16.p2  ORF type:complete len:181 (+),score=23.30 TRINITY_DN3779_c0_g1_i16:288-830(+)